MLATMATVTSGLLSPNSYGLNPDQVAAKMAAESREPDFDHYHHRSSMFRASNPPLPSSDSEPETFPSSTNSSKTSEPKRNKRKNFKPRCSNVSYSDTENNEALNLSELSNNNNFKNVRRRKTLSTRKIVVDTRFSPMDLSKSQNDTDSSSDDSETSVNDAVENYFMENDGDNAENEEESYGSERETESRIPSSFSIHNLSKPHVSEGQVSDMREYAFNTMRELLGIYGLTSEVAESISRQLPIAAFSSGKILENLSLNPHRKLNQSPPSQPPTPPSTPLSPKAHDVLNTKYTSSSVPFLPNLTITQTSSPSIPHNSNQSCQKGPLDLDTKKRKISSPYTNGTALNFSHIDVESMRIKGGSENSSGELKLTGHSSQHSPGAMFSANIMQFPMSKSEDGSPPPMENNPISAMLAQTMGSSHSRDSSQSHLMMNKTQSQVDYSKYVRKFSSSLECGSTYCKDLNYREHFHCLDCNSRVFIKKEEMIRHFKWHKKRDESLQHGFMRYSPLDDCSDRYANCSHNKKQTHYHCIKEGCDKVYISTSDVQMHANYHRKDSAIIQEGFQRYRATEECGASYCSFFGQRTTHFHCRRSGCRFTFKNKSDMEKHKTYHIKDEQLSRDGFKKFMKNEVCPYENCRFSKVCNHIHCIRPQCNYVLHSSGQLFSHKRKHERKDSELAYRKYKLAQSMMKTLQDGNLGIGGLPRDYDPQLEGLNLSMFHQGSMSTYSNLSNSESMSERNSPVSYEEGESSSAIDLSGNDFNTMPQEETPSWNGEDFWRKYCQYFGPQESCVEKCEYSYSEHFHCLLEYCEMVFNSKDAVREHARNHEQQEQVTETFFVTVPQHGGTCEESCLYQDKEKHYHCNIENCREVILATDKPFKRLEHYKMHEYSRKLSLTKDPLTMTYLATSIDGMFCRKRGRPPKNRVIEVWNDYAPMGSQSLMDSPQAIFTSFKLPKPSATVPSNTKENDQHDSNDERSNSPSNNQSHDYSLQGFDLYNENTKCPDSLCPYLGNVHYHCNQNRCLYVTEKEDLLILHSKDFHDNIEILDGFEFYDRNVDCRLPNCPSNKTNRHFHCTRPNCNYSFVQYSSMAIHNQKHIDESEHQKLYGSINQIRVKSEPGAEEKPCDNIPESQQQFRAINLSQSTTTTADNKVSVVKASGTFYPLSTIPTAEGQKSPELNKFVPAENPTLDSPTTNMGSQTLYGPELSCSRPFCKLKRKFHYHCNACNQAFSEVDKLITHVAKHSTGALGGQMQEEVQQHQQTNTLPVPTTSSSTPSTPPTSKPEPKINVAPLHSLQNPPLPKSEPETTASYLTTPTFDAYSHFTNFNTNLATQFALMSQQQGIQSAFLPQSLYQNAGIPAQLMFQHGSLMQNPLLPPQNPFGNESMTSPLAAMAANLNKRTMSPHELSPEQKKARLQSSMRILKDEPVPEGYLRFKFNEDCQYPHCGYREHQTHFHCQRQDCGYSFCDKTRFVQHTARHERLDTLMGGDFQQYRANVACGRPECAYTTNLGSTQNKASHFHCLKCDFVCTDTNKVVAHRRQHQKLDSIQAAGFEKFTPSQQCKIINCQHSGKQTHYHCLSCQYAVLGLAQMSAHKYRHLEG